MKRTITLLALALSLCAATGCKDKKEQATETSTPGENKKEIHALGDKFHDAIKKKNAESLRALTTDNGFY